MSASDAKRASRYRYTFGEVVVDESEMALYLTGNRVQLERRAIELLIALLENSDEAMTKEELLDSVWSGQTTVENVLANAIAKVRRALGPDHAERVETLPRIGYRFSGPVERVAVGRKLISMLTLKQGDLVPLRPHYVLQQQLSARAGREVWRARHEKTGESRIFKFASDSAALASLKREATLFRFLSQSLGAEAPIVQVYDWNFSQEPFFLESADGKQDLAHWASKDAHLERLSIAERIELAIRLIEAVSKAHNVGVIHKDLKPSNILMDSSIQLRLADFGSSDILAREALEKADLTPLGWTHSDLVNPMNSTPIYTAPEVFEGAAYSIRSDVYALGVITYQIVTCQLGKPMAPGWEDDLNDPLLAADIAAATHGDPERRLAIAASLSDRLKRLSERREAAKDAALQAEMERALARARQRRPWIIAAGVSLLAGLGASLWFGIETANARQEAERRANQAELAREFLLETLYYTTPAIDSGEANEVWIKALDRAEAQLSSIYDEDPETFAALSLAAGRIREGTGNSDAAIEHFSNAAAKYRALEGGASMRTIESEFRQAFNMLQLQRTVEAEPLIAAATARLAQLNNPSFELQYLALDVRASLVAKQQNIDLAMQLHDEQIAMYTESADAKRRALAYRNDYDRWSRAHLHLAQLQAGTGDIETARATIAPVLALLQAGDTKVNEHARLNIRFVGAYLSLVSGEFKETISNAQTALAIAESLYGKNNIYTGTLIHYIALSYMNMEAYARAAQIAGEAMELACKDGIANSATCSLLIDTHALSTFHLGPRINAQTDFQKLLSFHTDASGENSIDAMRMRYFLAQIELDQRNMDKARELIDGVDFAKLNESDPLTTWLIYERGLEARFAYLDNPNSESKGQLERTLTKFRAQGVSETLIAPFASELEPNAE